MITAYLIWWHRVILRHKQRDVMNGPTEPGVLCYCLRGSEYPYYWFPSDGGGGK